MEVSIDISDGFRIYSNGGTDMGSLVTENNYELLIQLNMVPEDNLQLWAYYNMLIDLSKSE